MAAAKFTKGVRARTVSPGFEALLGRFFSARAVIETACRAMENGEDYAIETSTLRSGIRMLDVVYEELDLAINRLPGGS